MTNFKDLYKNTKTYPAETIYKGKKVVLADRFPISDKETLIVTTEKTKSKYCQGFFFGVVKGSIKFLEQQHKSKYFNFFLWERPKPYQVQIFTRKGFIYIQNAWYDPSLGANAPACWAGCDGWTRYSEWGGAGMIVEEIENGRRYYCNDGECDDDFDDIIFTVTRVKK